MKKADVESVMIPILYDFLVWVHRGFGGGSRVIPLLLEDFLF